MGDSRFPCLSKRFPLYHNFLPQPGVFLHIFQCDRAPLHTSKTQFRKLFSKLWSAAPTGGCPRSDGIWTKFEHQNNAFAKENDKNKGNLRCPEFLVPGCWKKSWKRTTIFFSSPNSTKLLRLKGNPLCTFWQFQLHIHRCWAEIPMQLVAAVCLVDCESPNLLLSHPSTSCMSCRPQASRFLNNPSGRLVLLASLRLLVHHIRWKEWQMVHQRSITSPEIWENMAQLLKVFNWLNRLGVGGEMRTSTTFFS